MSALTLILTLMLTLILTMSMPAGATDSAPAATLQELDKRLAEAFVERGIPGASVALVEDGKITFLKDYGVADKASGVPVTPDTVFRAASISKSFTSIGIMMLVEQGKLKLDARLADLAPEIKFNNPWEQSAPVRLVHLLEHTSGWPVISGRIEITQGPGWPLRRGIEFASPEFVSRWQPGQFAVYSNNGPAVAGLVLEKVAAQDFSSFERDRVLRPMGMPSADFDLTPALASRLARSYGANGAQTPYLRMILPPSGSLSTSVRELAKLVEFFIGRGSVDGRQLLSPQSVERIERSESSLASYGLGNFPLNDVGTSYRGHNGEIDSFTSLYGYSASQRTGYVVLANGGEGVDAKTPISSLMQTYLNRQHAFAPLPQFPIAQGDLSALAGFYRNVTPAKSLMRPYAEALGFAHVAVGDGRPLIGKHAYFATTARSFRRDDRDNASLAFVQSGGDSYLVSGGLGDRKREPGWRIGVYCVVGAITLLGGVLALCGLPVWLFAAYRKKLAAQGGLTLRILPLLAFATCAGTFVLPFVALTSGIGMLAKLAEPGMLCMTILACSVAFPLLAAAGLWRALRCRQAGRLIRWYAGLTSSAILALAAYAAAIGWIGLRTWTM